MWAAITKFLLTLPSLITKLIDLYNAYKNEQTGKLEQQSDDRKVTDANAATGVAVETEVSQMTDDQLDKELSQ